MTKPDHPQDDPIGDLPPEAAMCVRAHRLSIAGDGPVAELCRVVGEDAVTIVVEGGADYRLMCTPHDLLALAVGFAFSEGIIDGPEDLHAAVHCEDDPRVVRLRVKHPERAGLSERNLPVVSSCGMCGARNSPGQLLRDVPPVGETLCAAAALLQEAGAQMRARQAVFTATGGAHAAGIFTADGAIVAFAEDIGRHSALDKALGRCLLERRPTAGCGAVLSGRVSFELVAKAARAGLEVMAAVSAPSSLAVQAAEHWNITLCGFVRGDRATVYTHPRRISDMAERPAPGAAARRATPPAAPACPPPAGD